MAPITITDDVFKDRREIQQSTLVDMVVKGGSAKIKEALVSTWNINLEQQILAVPSITLNTEGKISGAK